MGSRLYTSSAKEAVSTICEVFVPPSNDKGNEVHLLITDSSWVLKLDNRALSRTTKLERRIREGRTGIPVKPTSVVCAPESVCTAYP